MISLKWSINQTTDEVDDETELFVGNSHTNALYSTLSRHTLRPTPYAAQNLGGQIQEHIAVTPRAAKVLNLGTRIMVTLTQYTHCCSQHLQILLNSLQILTSARHPNEKQEKDWLLTLQTAQILRINLRKFDSKDLIALGAKGEESLLTFVRTHLISHGSRWMIKQSFKAWSDVRARLTMNLYGIIRELLGLQFKFDLFHEDMLQVIADSLTDITQSDKLVLYGLHFLHFMPNLNMEQDSSPLDGVILKILRSRWVTNRLDPRVWAKGHSQRMITRAAGESLNPGESAQLTQLTTEVTSYYVHCAVHDHQEMEMKASFLQTGSTWLRDLAINNMSNWSRMSLLTTEIILNTMAFTQDDPITYGNCIHVLSLLSSDERTGSRIRDLGGMDEIMDFLPKQFPEKRGEVTQLQTSTLHNSNLRFTLRTLRHLTDPDDDDLHESRTNRNTNLKKVFDTLQAWMRDETSQGLTFQVLYNLIRESDKTRDPAQQDFSTHPDAETDMDP